MLHALGSWNYVASCGSSAYEGASDVSRFHTCFTFPLCTCCWLLFVFVCVLVLCFFVCFCFSGFVSARVTLVVFSSRVLDVRASVLRSQLTQVFDSYAGGIHQFVFVSYGQYPA